MRNDSDFGDQAMTFGEKHEFADFLWLPSQGKVVYRIDDRVPFNTPGNGLFNFFPFRPQLTMALAITRSLGSFFISQDTRIYVMYGYNDYYMFLVHNMKRSVTSCLEMQTGSV